MPDGAFVGGAHGAWRIETRRGRLWSWDGYGTPVDLPASVPLLTPLAIVQILDAGYRVCPNNLEAIGRPQRPQLRTSTQ